MAAMAAAKTRDNKTRHWNVDDYMVARGERAGGRYQGRESERAKIAVEFEPGEPPPLLLLPLLGAMKALIQIKR